MIIKFTACLKRRPDISREEFHKYWLENHGPLFKKYAAEYKAIRYVQSHTVEQKLNDSMRSSRGYMEEFDGIGEIWWDRDTFFKIVSSERGQQLRKIFIEDESKFIDFTRSSGFFTIEHVLIENPFPIP